MKLGIRKHHSLLIGAAFIMATSSIGPGFMMQTGVFTNQWGADFGYAILVSLVVATIAQVNVWRILCASSKQGQELANALLPYAGHGISYLVALGGLIFNIGNVGGAALGLSVITGWDLSLSAALSGGMAIIAIWDSRQGLERVAKWLGLLMIAALIYMVVITDPPIGQALRHTIWPDVTPWMATLTLIGGTVGGYITFSGGHRLLDQGISGPSRIKDVTKSAVIGMCVDGSVRVLLFLAVWGVLVQGHTLGMDNPLGDAFYISAGYGGYVLFGCILLCAALTSIVGAAYTSISFLRTSIPWLVRRERVGIVLLIGISTLCAIYVGKPTVLLILAGAFNGWILPVTLTLLLVATKRKDLMGSYQHPMWLSISGWVVVFVTAYMAWLSLEGLTALWGSIV